MADKERDYLSPEERAKFAAEARKLDAETRKEKALAQEAEHKAAVSKVARDREEDKRKRELASDDRHHLYRFIGAVDSGSVGKCIAQLDFWTRTEKGCAIEIEFNSPGGLVHPGMALFDCIQDLRRNGHHVTTSAKGYAASMGGILLQAGDNRVLSREAYVLIHEVQAGALGTMGELEDEMAFLRKIQSRILDIFAERCKLSKRQLARRWKRKNWWIASDEALKLGLVDEVR